MLSGDRLFCTGNRFSDDDVIEVQPRLTLLRSNPHPGPVSRIQNRDSRETGENRRIALNLQPVSRLERRVALLFQSQSAFRLRADRRDGTQKERHKHWGEVRIHGASRPIFATLENKIIRIITYPMKYRISNYAGGDLGFHHPVFRSLAAKSGLVLSRI